MSGFAQALSSYRTGALSREQLLAEVDLELTSGMSDTATLLAILNDEQSKGRLPGNVHLEIVRKLLRWGEMPSARDAAGRSQQPAGIARITAIGGGILIIVLLAAYFLDRGRLARWTGSGSATPAAPAQGELFRDCPTCPLMKALPPGQFEQGATTDQADATDIERPQHLAKIAYPFGIGVYEVTVGEYREFVKATARSSAGCSSYDGAWLANADLNWDNVGYPQTAAHPVTCVSWRDARDYASWLSGKSGQHYRLPSDSEWEYAARAGMAAARPWEARLETACAWANVADLAAGARFPGWNVVPCNDGYIYTAPVGSFKPNAFGLYDMLGNVFEWVQDCWHENYHGAPANGSAWSSGDCTQHSMRGGSWFTSPALVSVSSRNRFEETYRSNSVGFRLVREIRP